MGVEAQEHRHAIHGSQVIYIEASGERHFQFFSVEGDGRAIKSLFYHLCFKVGKGAQRVGVVACRAILQHHGAHLIVGIHQGKGIAAKAIEKRFFGFDIGIHGFVEVEVVAREVGKHAPGESQPLDAVLCASVRTHFHKSVVASGIHHFGEQSVEGQVVGGGLLGRVHLAVHHIFHRREQPRLVAHHLGEAIKQRGDGGFAVGAGHPHQFEFGARIIIPCAGNVCHYQSDCEFL